MPRGRTASGSAGPTSPVAMTSSSARARTPACPRRRFVINVPETGRVLSLRGYGRRSTKTQADEDNTGQLWDDCKHWKLRNRQVRPDGSSSPGRGLARRSGLAPAQIAQTQRAHPERRRLTRRCRKADTAWLTRSVPADVVAVVPGGAEACAVLRVVQRIVVHQPRTTRIR